MPGVEKNKHGLGGGGQQIPIMNVPQMELWDKYRLTRQILEISWRADSLLNSIISAISL